MGFVQKTKYLIKNQSLFSSFKWCIDYNTLADLFRVTSARARGKKTHVVSYLLKYLAIYGCNLILGRFMKEVRYLPR